MLLSSAGVLLQTEIKYDHLKENKNPTLGRAAGCSRSPRASALPPSLPPSIAFHFFSFK